MTLKNFLQNLKDLREQWSLYGNVPINRNNFNEFITNYIGNYLKSYDECDKTIIRLPDVLSKSERYSIHRLAIRNQFSAMSYDLENNRIMEITLSKTYVLEIFIGFVFVNDTIIEIKTDKQILFDSMISFIQQNLENEFNNFLNTI